MANPNIVSVTAVYGQTVGAALGTSASTLINTSTDSVRKINSITVANVDGTNDADVTVYATIDSSTRYLAYQITVPAKSTLVVTSKDTSFYLEESDVLYALASAESDLEIIVSYDEIS
jgi:hypothetical protein